MSENQNLVPARPIGNIYCGTCSWTDRTLIESGGFYAADIRSPEARLRYYAQVFPMVEVDSTYYALPSEQNARLWAERTPFGFVFNIKAFGLLTQHPIDPRRLPDVIRERLPSDVLDKGRLYHSSVPAEIRELVWTMHIEALRPLAEAGKLGCLLFQFRRGSARTAPASNIFGSFASGCRGRSPSSSVAAAGWKRSGRAAR
jgi:uncharacterized protein YecE (DUF72 family)